MSFFQHLAAASAPTSSVTKNGITKSVTKKEPAGASSFVKEVSSSTTKKSGGRGCVSASGGKNRPEKIDVTTCDILYIDEQIKKNLRSKISTLEDLHDNLTKLLWIADNGDSLDKKSAKTETLLLRRAIQDIEGGFGLTLYLLKTTDLLEEYKKIVEETKCNSFMRAPNGDDASSAAKTHRKVEIISSFLRIAKEYIDISSYQIKRATACDYCHGSSLRAGISESTLLCETCGAEMDLLDDAPTFRDAERVNMSSRYQYTSRGHFIDAMNRFEGKQNTVIPDDVINILKEQLRLHGLDVLTAKDKITKDHIYMFLEQGKLSDYYADINLIFFIITGINPPDITGHRPELLEMYDQLEDAYASVKDPQRMNSLNVNWKLYKLLQILDYECRKDDFFCLKTPAKQDEHGEKWHDMIEYLRHKYPDAKTTKGKRRWRHIKSF
jgi:hypothetical protein